MCTLNPKLTEGMAARLKVMRHSEKTAAVLLQGRLFSKPKPSAHEKTFLKLDQNGREDCLQYYNY